MAKLVRDRAAARSVSASLLLSGRYLVIATSLKGRNDPFDAEPGVGQNQPISHATYISA